MVGRRPMLDPWLDRWIPRLLQCAGSTPVLEIGCGAGDDTLTLINAGFQVVGFDLSETQLEKAKLKAPSARLTCANVLEPFPLEGAGIGAVVASLSLHYFPWATTLALANRLRLTLKEDGVLLCRLNATDDYHFGASGHKEIEPNYYLVNGEPKRFFDRPSIEALFSAGWEIESLEHYVTRKYGAPKALWEVVVRGLEIPAV